MKKPECPNCGSENVMLETDLPEIQFWIDENENVDFEPTDIRDRLESGLVRTSTVNVLTAVKAGITKITNLKGRIKNESKNYHNSKRAWL